MSPRLNLDLTEASDFSPLPDGSYAALVHSVSEPERSSRTGTLMVKIEYEIQVAEFQGRKLTQYAPLEGKGAGIFQAVWLAATGEELEFGEAGIECDTDEMIGSEVVLVVSSREYEGNTYNDIKRVLAVG